MYYLYVLTHNKKDGDNMNILLYIAILLSKIIENTLSTLRLILVANGKKFMGAILQFIIALVWIFAAGAVVKNIGKDLWSVFFFALGSFIGSFLGSYMEEKIAMGTNMLVVTIDWNKAKIVTDELRKKKYIITSIKGLDEDTDKCILFIMIERKKRHELVEYICKLDNRAVIISEKAKTIY